MASRGTQSPNPTLALGRPMHAPRAACLGLLALLAVQPSVVADGHARVWIWSDPGEPPFDAGQAPSVLRWLEGRGVAAHLYPNLGMVAFEAPSSVAASLGRQW